MSLRSSDARHKKPLLEIPRYTYTTVFSQKPVFALIVRMTYSAVDPLCGTYSLRPIVMTNMAKCDPSFLVTAQ